MIASNKSGVNCGCGVHTAVLADAVAYDGCAGVEVLEEVDVASILRVDTDRGTMCYNHVARNALLSAKKAEGAVTNPNTVLIDQIREIHRSRVRKLCETSRNCGINERIAYSDGPKRCGEGSGNVRAGIFVAAPSFLIERDEAFDNALCGVVLDSFPQVGRCGLVQAIASSKAVPPDRILGLDVSIQKGITCRNVSKGPWLGGSRLTESSTNDALVTSPLSVRITMISGKLSLSLITNMDELLGAGKAYGVKLVSRSSPR